MTQTWSTDDLASWLAHDLRTPLGAITGFAEALLDDSEMDPDSQREFLGIIHDEAQRLARMVEQAVRLVRLEKESSAWETSPVPVEHWLEKARQCAAAELEALGVTAETSPIEKPLVVHGASGPLDKALEGLLVGVGEFAGPGATLRLAVAADETTVTLTLRTGAFHLEEGQPAIAFHPFQRLGNAPRHDPVAAGLELALCAAIVARLGGRVWARPEGEGVCFSITLPQKPGFAEKARFFETPEKAIPAPAHEPTAPTLEESTPKSTPQSVRSVDSILIVDDQPFIRRSLSLALERAGYQVSTAVNGAEGLEQIRALRPSLVFLDLMMPVMDGFEVCCRVRTDPELTNTRIIMLTAKGETLDKDRSRTLGVDGYITKPFSPSAVVSHVREVLGGLAEEET